MYRILGNFSVIKGSHEKISLSKSFALWAFHENITHGENMEEYGRDWRIRSYTMMAGLSKQLDYTEVTVQSSFGALLQRASWHSMGDCALGMRS